MMDLAVAVHPFSLLLCLLFTCTVSIYEHVGHEATLSQSRTGEALVRDFSFFY